MGDVYLARDMQLGRLVALKVLPAALTCDDERRKRFIQEAFTTSALNHPNIVTVYEAEHIDSMHFIAMELIEGMTLHQKMAHGPLNISEALDLAAQVASALAAAHEAGITHRDIKPNNIMVRPDGYVKVLDFGLAKLTQQAAEIDREAPTLPSIHTEPGVILGTVNYMSPEQTRGLVVDARTDLWSLGCVLFEMLERRPPFEGVTRSDVIARIQESKPPSLSCFTQGAPEVLRWIVTKALTHDRDERYQTAREMLADLKKLSKHIDLEAERKRSDLPTVDIRPLPISGSASARASHRQSNTVEPGSPSPRMPGIVDRSERRRKIMLLSLVVGVVALGVTTLLVYRHTQRQRQLLPKQPETEIQKNITHLISGDGASNASISGDGKQVAYVDWRGGKPNLWIRQVSQDISTRIVKFDEENPQFYGTNFSPDGNIVYYVMAHKNDQQGTVYKVPAVGGRDPQAVRHGVVSPIALSPNGKEFAFIHYEQSGEGKLMIANTDDSSEPLVRKTRKLGDAFGPIAWSPDGEKLAYAVNALVDCCTMTVVEISVKGGEEKHLTSNGWGGGIGQLCWLKDGSGLVLTGVERRGGRSQIWYLSHTDGKTRNIVNDLTDYGPNMSVTEDSSTLVVDVYDSAYSIGVVDKTGSRQITNGKYDGIGAATWTPDGRIVYVTQASGNYDICIMNTDGTDNKLLLSDPSLASVAAVSPDGRYIVIVSEREGNINRIWRMNIDGSHLKRLTNGVDFSPNFSSDGRWLVYNNQRDGKVTLWKVPIEGGEAVQLSDKVLFAQIPSPDGKWVSCTYFEGINKQGKIVLFSLADGSLKPLDSPPGAAPPAWWHKGQDYLYLTRDNNADTFWSQPVNGGRRVKVASFWSGTIHSFMASSDDKLVLAHRSWNSDIALIKNFK